MTSELARKAAMVILQLGFCCTAALGIAVLAHSLDGGDSFGAAAGAFVFAFSLWKVAGRLPR